jgi:hypothetical protein
MRRIGAGAIVVAVASAIALLTAVKAQGVKAEGAQQPELRLAQATVPDAPPQRPLHRPSSRLRVEPLNEPDEVYPHYNPGPGAVRECNATYVQEYRPSGTVIVPRMSCRWRRG